jgi:hypothetical protein
MWSGSARSEEHAMSIVSDLLAPARGDTDLGLPEIVNRPLIPGQRESVHDSVDQDGAIEDIPADVLEELRDISECFRACRAKANALRESWLPGDPIDRGRRDELARSLQRLHELRERRSALLDAYDLPSRAGRD